MNYELATIGGGCFWCFEAIYRDLKGVVEAVSGFAGGFISEPTYQQVISGTTGHAEVVQIQFDPEIVTFEDLMNIFFTFHDPTTVNQQGNDVGEQYRSVVLYHNQKQKEVTEKIMKKFEEDKIWKKPIVTEVKEFEKFYSAESYHQNYFNDNRNQPYCQFVIEPKVAKFRKLYYNKLKN